MISKKKRDSVGQQHIVCVHLINDFGGTSLILSEIIEGLIVKKYTIEVYTSTSSEEGFLSSFINVAYHKFYHRAAKRSFFVVVNLFVLQFLLFFKLLKYYRKPVVFYINTLMPFGAALAARVMRKRVVFHIHEISVKPQFLNWWCKLIAHYCANDVIYVSQFIKRKKELNISRNHVVRNALSPSFITKTIHNRHREDFTILMLCNLKIYKGVIEFVQIARLLPQYRFEMVLNAHEDEINAFFKNIRFSENLIVHSSQPSVHRFYARASLVINLSHADKWLESFGMTVLEAMSYGLPVIVPPRGGISELVVDDYNGYHLSYNDLDSIVAMIIRIAENPELYLRLSNGSQEVLSKYSYEEMIGKVDSILKTGSSDQ
ncbi:MAG: glycosyltransferase family 4 protein [Salinivirgaceae bacterium]|nr:glycosyltransferase family 4 protein [Salinivirgaceae bacterium]